jgi:hypothetical protein
VLILTELDEERITEAERSLQSLTRQNLLDGTKLARRIPTACELKMGGTPLAILILSPLV